MRDFTAQTPATDEWKLNRIGIYNKLAPYDPNKVVFNYSSRIIPQKVKTLLALGLEFCLPVHKLNSHRYFISFEYCVFKLNNLRHPAECYNFISKCHMLVKTYFTILRNMKYFPVYLPIIMSNYLKLLLQTVPLC